MSKGLTMPAKLTRNDPAAPDLPEPVRRGKRGSESTAEAATDDPKVLRKANRELRKHLLGLVNTIKWFTNRLNAEMKLPADYEWGKRIARLTNALSYSRETAEYFGLKVDYRKAKDLTLEQLEEIDRNFAQIHEFNKKLRDDLHNGGNSRFW